MTKLLFSGHDSFHCRQFWLKKGYDFVNQGNKFPDQEAPIHLGVGKNMVTAIRHWLKSFGLANSDDELTEIAHKLLGDNGWDPYLEDQGSLWLLHYLLVRENYASLYPIVFSELANERPEFTQEHFISFVGENKEGDYNENTLKRDFTAFYRNYFGRMNRSDVEESFTGILTELHLLKEKRKKHLNSKGKEEERPFWVLEKSSRNDIPLHILLFAILDNPDYGTSVSFKNLYEDKFGLGNIFLLNREGLTIALERMQSELNYGIVFSNEAGIRELQFKKKLEPAKILEDYYGN
ncbi:DUF4007 family protein [Salibacter halophilus]|uniref:DUF4007 family protein n=1 Tax=Salibacter halophilus TaxID=1803916 RepID=A0A6N6M6S2_9FLAO|nr:DUF4007 family protein [Salibacter halophilus]KAB1065612.1 DUF4007 family protein [Salibacter halophilus]